MKKLIRRVKTDRCPSLDVAITHSIQRRCGRLRKQKRLLQRTNREHVTRIPRDARSWQLPRLYTNGSRTSVGFSGSGENASGFSIGRMAIAYSQI